MTDTIHSPVRRQTRDNVAFLLIDNPPVNATSQRVRAGLLGALTQALADPGVSAIVIACEGRTFVAGADIEEFGQPPLKPGLPDVCRAVEDSAKPVVAAIHGTALGGGLEIALSCHARIVTEDAKVGLPEVKLGLIPGSGGTQRLPRLTGFAAALDLIASGRMIGAQEAFKCGIVDRIAQGDLRAEAGGLALTLVGTPLRRTGQLPAPPFDAERFDAAEAASIKRARGQESPRHAAQAVRLAATLPIEDGMQRERQIFMELMNGGQSKALRYAFFAEREAMRAPLLAGVQPRPLAHIGIVGGGTMGAGIAVALADAALSVILVETSPVAVDAARTRVSAIYERQTISGRISASESDARRARIAFANDLAALAPCDLVIEAVFEDMAVKQDVFRKLAAVAKPDAVLATNTSYLDVNGIAAASARAQDVIGLHFFAPANIMRLVEIVTTTATAPVAAATGFALAKRLGKVPVVCGVCDGFVGNRMLAAWRQQAEYALEDGALPQEVDAALEAFGFPMGPFAVADLSGLDIAWARRKRLAATRDPEMRYASTIADRLCEMGRLGQKTGAGWYRYENGKRIVDPAVSQLVEEVSRQGGRARANFDARALQRKIRAVIVNEGSRILSEGVAARALDIDMAMIHGYGYPAWRGGPMFEADAIGLRHILRDVEMLYAEHGRGFEPAALLRDLAESNGAFASFTRAAKA